MKRLKKTLSFGLAILFILTVLPITAFSALAAENNTEFAGGEGTEEKPYLISTTEHLDNVRKYPDANYKMISDIEFAKEDFEEDGIFYNEGNGWEPLGTDSSAPFIGVFDGNGHTIKGLQIQYNAKKGGYAGLFGYNKGKICNLGIIDSNVSIILLKGYGTLYSGGIAGYNNINGIIENCYNTGSVSSSSDVLSEVVNTYSGGIAGINAGLISRCYNSGTVSADTSRGYAYSGGIAGRNGEEFKNNGVIEKCYNTGSINNNISGGIAGYSSGEINNCYNTGNINAESPGGIVGEGAKGGSISNCYNIGSISITYGKIAGFFGGIIAGTKKTTISSCYYSNAVPNGTDEDTDTTVNCTVEELKKQETYAGFDFDSVWKIDNTSSYPFPTLRDLEYTETDTENTTDFMGGSGSIFNPYLIANKTQLNNIRKYLDANFEIISDIEFTKEDFEEGGIFYNDGKGWEPLGTDGLSAFNGTLNGNGHTIKGLYCNQDVRYAGLFGFNRGKIYNLGIIDSNISTALISDSYSVSAYSGGIAGYNAEKGVISNCYNTGSVYAECVSTSTSSSTNANAYSGGISGFNRKIISNCYNIGNVSAEASSKKESNIYVGGITGSNYLLTSFATVSNCYYLDTASVGVGEGIDTAIKCTDAEMQLQETFAGFDFSETWKIDASYGYPYPQFQNESTASIHVTKLPSITKYTIGGNLSTKDGKITLFYGDKALKEIDITPDMITGFDSSKAGKVTLTVTYGGFTDTFEVEIVSLSYIPGDVNGDGDVSIKDVLETRKYAVGIAVQTTFNEAAADVDGDRIVTIRDVLLIRKIVLGID